MPILPISRLKRRVLLIGAAVTILVSFIVTVELVSKNHRSTDKDIPLPFGQQGSSLKGELTLAGARSGGINVYDVTFNHGELSAHLASDTIYLVHIPNGDSIADVPLDSALTLSNGGHLVDYYGYRYSDPSATLEKRDINAIRFKDRFSGQFFLSQTGRVNDPVHGNALSAFETVNDIKFLRTDSATGARLDPAGALYVFVINSEGGADLSVRRVVTCGNAIIESGEDCDDGNLNENDQCHNDCTIGLPIPFDDVSSFSSSTASTSSISSSSSSSSIPNIPFSSFSSSDSSVSSSTVSSSSALSSSASSTAISTCGDGTLDQSETCDDGNAANSDGCSSSCTVETSFSCTKASPSVCTSHNAFVKNLADTNHDGAVSDNEALLLMLDLVDAPDRPYDVKFDINNDGKIDNADVTIIFTVLDILAP